MADFFDNKTPQVSWTLAQHLVDNMSNLFQRASNAFIDRNYSRYFDCLLDIKQAAVQSFNPKERAELTSQEENILKNITFLSNENLKTNQFKLWVKINNISFKLINKYRTTLMDALQHHGYLNPEKMDRTKLVG